MKKRKKMTKEFIDFYSKNIDKNSIQLKVQLIFLNGQKIKNISMAVCTNKQETRWNIKKVGPVQVL